MPLAKCPGAALSVSCRSFWTASTGMLRLSANRRTEPYAMSDVRSNGTRPVVGMDDQADAAVWVVRIP